MRHRRSRGRERRESGRETGRGGEQRCRQSAVSTERRAETERESVERVQFPIGPRGRKKKGRRRGARELKKKKMEEEENGRRGAARLKGKPKKKEVGFHFSEFPVLSLLCFDFFQNRSFSKGEGRIPISEFPITFFFFWEKKGKEKLIMSGGSPTGDLRPDPPG
jgi:hypothetical protein